mmetsp:Transcript_16438/g.33675  ORF Transcript_16438/g.33675 Transcript_16438/m.33675 type:complete len:280 (+) Transcript_16438:341-1180(+)
MVDRGVVPFCDFSPLPHSPPQPVNLMLGQAHSTLMQINSRGCGYWGPRAGDLRFRLELGRFLSHEFCLAQPGHLGPILPCCPAGLGIVPLGPGPEEHCCRLEARPPARTRPGRPRPEEQILGLGQRLAVKVGGPHGDLGEEGVVRLRPRGGRLVRAQLPLRPLRAFEHEEARLGQVGGGVGVGGRAGHQLGPQVLQGRGGLPVQPHGAGPPLLRPPVVLLRRPVRVEGRDVEERAAPLVPEVRSRHGPLLPERALPRHPKVLRPDQLVVRGGKAAVLGL